MLVAFSVAPSQAADDSGSVSEAVAVAVEAVRASGLPCRTDAMFTTLEGEWEECMAAVKAAVDAVSAYGSRVSLVLKADIRPGHTGELDGKLERLDQALRRRADAAE
ncbi:MAG: thiamine-binding protein [Micrococcales bacterium]|nr:thiamine-binding protein [Micrococcales bacterium]